MIKSPAEINLATKLSRLEQRTIDVMLEMEMFRRQIVPKTLPKPLINPDKPVSYVEQLEYEANKNRYKDTRLVPFFTRAKEAVVHTLQPEISKHDLCIQIVDGGNWTSVHIVAKSNNLSIISDAIHEDFTVAVSVATLKAVFRNPTELARKFVLVRNLIGR